MTDIVERLRLDAEPTEGDMEEAAAEIERLRKAIVEWADAINYAEGTLFLDKVPSKKLIEEILELAVWEAK